MKRLSELLKNQRCSIPDNILKLLLIQSKWADYVGGFLSRISMPFKLDSRKLTIGVLDNIVIQELTFKKDEIIEKLANMNINIKEIQFKIVNNNVFCSDSDKKEKTSHVDLSAYNYLFDSIKNNDIKVSFKKAFREYIKYLKDYNIDI